MKRHCSRAVCALALLALALPLRAGDATFGSVVARLERSLGIHQQCVPMMGLASFLVRVARPAGVSEFRLAIFDSVSTRHDGAAQAFRREVEQATRGEWSPLIRVTDRRSGELTSIAAQQVGKRMKLLVAVVDEDNAVVMEVKVDADTLRDWLNDHDAMRRGIHATWHGEN